MKNEDYYPSPCELDAFVAASIEACDQIDGVADGIVGNPDLCHYDAHELVGLTVQCSDNTTIIITEQAANVVQQIWAGPVDTDGSFLFYPLGIGADLTFTANTSLVDGRRGPSPQALPKAWIPNFIKKNQSFDVLTLDHQEFVNVFRRGIKEYDSIINNHDPDLREFRASGAKLLAWVGTLDQISPKKPLNAYYDEVRALLPDVEDFYRMFSASGCGHCGANKDGSGYLPENPLRYLTAWVENGTAPDTMLGVNQKTGREQPLCIWPKVARWDGVNNASVATSYSCEDSY
jgi:feruloyl esterase